ncbi:MAG: hypothetical protein FHK78_01515 [Sedimenticola selenatireducens]|uniref:Uncharacterized protein n=1 Tax=Sedimenticola selenatireducens TaxID=191960 RepID=A0A557SCG6_9GAMM|nr:hypothetical protein FHP88_08840 [Sedimenticola selenatireducens]TVT67036.1 MAG: hypothetical protein FHK78_01515 [Sedimenticola selenatireducens]
MPCLDFGNAIICVTAGWYRMRTADGRYFFMDWHDYLGPSIYKDRAATRGIDNWWDDAGICNAVDWFQLRGNRA